jgi:asparagine synthase (glutamine-hydrolysing)
MCAIFGIVGEYDDAKAKSALDRLHHRGPDNCSITQKQNLFIAHQHLRITDSSSQSKQILKNDNILVSFNGEIYNYIDLQKELDAKSELEVIYKAYKKWGVDFVNRLRGMFAISIMDKDTLYLFRDRLGKKPIFYLHNSSFIYASELKAIVPFLNKVEMDKDALLSYLSFLAPTAPYTFFKGIKKLGMGEYLIYKNSQVEVKKYFDLLDVKPNIIKDNGEVPTVHTATDTEYWQSLKAKLIEESEEMVSGDDVSELADVLEVIYAILDFKNLTFNELEDMCSHKRAERGGFVKRIILEKVT